MFSLEDIKSITKAEVFGAENPKFISHFFIDSRRTENKSSSMFICLKGKRKHGAEFIPSLYQKGIRYFLTDEETKYNDYPQATFFVVKDSLVALQKLATAIRLKCHMPVVGITGSNGKTIVKEWAHFVLSDSVQVYRSPASYNSQVGVPLSVLGIPEGADIAILEAGISQPGEMDLLANMIQCDIGLITNIGSAHDSGFKDRIQKTKEKVKLFSKNTEVITSDKNEVILVELKDRKIRTIKWSKTSGDYLIKINASSGDNTKIGIKKDGKEWEVNIPFNDNASVENAIHTFVLCHRLFPSEINTWINRFEVLPTISMRMEMKSGIRNCVLLCDYYNSDLASFQNALEFANMHHSNLSKTLILSDFVEANDSIYTYLEELLPQGIFQKIILIGEEIQQINISKEGIELHRFNGVDDYLNSPIRLNHKNEFILLKGSRKFHFEDIARQLMRAVYGTKLEVDIEALLHNWQYLKGKLSQDTKTMVMVKASAYGTGFLEIAQCFVDWGADYLGVAYPNEGVILRESGVKVPIMVMNTEAASLELLQRYDLEPEIYSHFQLDAFLELLGPSDFVKAHLKLDTGMHRLGFEENDLDGLIQKLRSCDKRIEVVSVFTHLLASDDPGYDEGSLKQIELFEKMSERLKTELAVDYLEHILNSAGILRFAQAQKDMVRMGIGLYGTGIKGFDQLKPVHVFSTYISQIKNVKPGDTVGYGGEFTFDENRVIGTIPVGYADGIPRNLGEGKGSFMIYGQFAPIVGRVCMDMTMIDLTNIEDIFEGQRVEIFGESRTLNEFSAMAGTISYEILARISPRVERVFTKG